MSAPLAGKSILLASEDADLAALVREALLGLGAAVLCAAAGRDAFAALARSPDAAVLDLPLPDARAGELLAALVRANVPAVVVSGVYRGERSASDLRRLGARDFFEKPFPLEALARAVSSAIAPAAPVAGGARRTPAGAGADGRAPPSPGDLAQTPVPRVLVALHLGQASGALTVSQGPVSKIVHVERGAVVHATSNLPGERLDHEPRAEVVASGVRAIVWSTFEWREGSHAFALGPPPAVRVPLRFAMGELLLEGMRASSLDRLLADLPRDVHLAPSPDPAFELYALRLGAEEARLLSLADGTKSVGDLLRLSDLAEREALAFLQACRVMRILDEAERVLASTRRIGFLW